VQQLTHTQPKASTGSNRTERHVNALFERRLRRAALPEEARSVKRQVVVSKLVKDGPKKVCFNSSRLFPSDKIGIRDVQEYINEP
jgi:hypothetical protein